MPVFNFSEKCAGGSGIPVRCFRREAFSGLSERDYFVTEIEPESERNFCGILIIFDFSSDLALNGARLRNRQRSARFCPHDFGPLPIRTSNLFKFLAQSKPLVAQTLALTVI